MHQKKFDLIAIGEAGLDTFLKLDEASLLCGVDRDKCWLCLTYAEKIPVAQMHESLGHNACNVSVGGARLGLRTALTTVIGDDDVGEKILKKLKSERVSTAYIQVKKKSSSTASVVLNYHTERTLLIYHQPFKLHLPKLAPASWLYLTSLGKDFRSVHRDVLEQITSNGWKIAFNPGDQQLKAGRKVLEPILRVTEVLIVNVEEAERLLGISEKQSPKILMKNLLALGPRCIILTDGQHGAYGYDGKKQYRVRNLPSHVKERTGAGDSFSTGVLAALAKGRSLDEGLLWGAGNAASVIEHIGPQQGLLTSHALARRVKNHASCVSELR